MIAEDEGISYEAAEEMLSKDWISLKDDKDEMMSKLEKLYNRQERQEIEDEYSGNGVRGSDGVLSRYSIDDLFNEVIWKSRHQEFVIFNI